MSLIMTQDGWKQLQPKAVRQAPAQEGLRYTGPLPTSEAVEYGKAIRRYLLPRSNPEHISLESCLAVMGRRTVIK